MSDNTIEQLQQMQTTTCVGACQLAADMTQALTKSWDVDVCALGCVPTASWKETEITITSESFTVVA